MPSEETTGVFIDYQYIQDTLERHHQINPLPARIAVFINETLSSMGGAVLFEKIYGRWDNQPLVKAVFLDSQMEAISYKPTLPDKNVTDAEIALASQLTADALIAWDMATTVYSSTNPKTIVLVSGDSVYADMVAQINQMGIDTVVMAFDINCSRILRENAGTYLTLDSLINDHHEQDIERIIDIYISLSRKLPYVGYKYLVDILSRNNLSTDYRQVLNQAQDEGILRLVEVDDPNTIRGKAFAIELVSSHPRVVNKMEEKGLTTSELHPPSSVGAKPTTTPEAYGPSGVEDHGDPRFLAGKRLLEIGQYEAAISEFFNYLDDFENDFLGFIYVINCLIKSGDRKKARLWCEKALSLPNAARNQKEYPRWFNYMKKIANSDNLELDEELEEKVDMSEEQ